MHSQFSLSISIFLVVLSASSFAGWDDYHEKSFQQTINENFDILGRADLNNTPGLPQLVLVTYTGEKRPIPKDREEVVRGWIKMIRQAPEVGDLYLTEMKFFEQGQRHWVPVQKSLIMYFENEIRPGDKVWLYARWIGTTKTDWVFVINEFKKETPLQP